jgi:predicted AlkP superfamily phosphohydrolase/phosphomutase
MRQDKKVFLIGLDGATFTLIKPWVAQGHLPTFAKLLSEGCHGVLTSTFHPISPHAWTSCVTGKNAGKHGIFDFLERRPGTYESRFVSAASCASDTIWKILSDQGKRVGGLNIPLSYPPEPVNGFLISGLGAPGKNSEFIYPPSLKEVVFRRVVDYKLLDVDQFLDDPLSYITFQYETVSQTLELSNYLLETFELDFFMVVFNAIDQTQHIFWHTIDREHPLYNEEEHRRHGHVLLELHKKIDKCLADFIRRFQDDYNIIVMSDHGFGHLKKTVRLYKWLEEQKYLRFSQNKQNIVKKMINKLFKDLRVKAQTLPQKWKNEIRRLLSPLVSKYDSYLSAGNIAWDQTKAYSWGNMGNIIINFKGREPQGIVNGNSEYQRLCDEIIDKLYAMTDPETHEKVIERVYRREELYHGDRLNQAPDLVVVFKDYAYQSVPSQYMDPNQSVFTPIQEEMSHKTIKPASNHRIEGICFFLGEDIHQGLEIHGARIIDIAPTILYLLGLPIPADIDGCVLKEIFPRNFLEAKPVQYQGGTGKKDKLDSYFKDQDKKAGIEKMLRGLGYME